MNITFNETVKCPVQKSEMLKEYIRELKETPEYKKAIVKQRNEKNSDYRKHYYENIGMHKERGYKYCNTCQKDICYFGWNAHLKTKQHTDKLEAI